MGQRQFARLLCDSARETSRQLESVVILPPRHNVSDSNSGIELFERHGQIPQIGTFSTNDEIKVFGGALRTEEQSSHATNDQVPHIALLQRCHDERSV